jgi:steroid delta-isomerase-like uncharacterized protein
MIRAWSSRRRWGDGTVAPCFPMYSATFDWGTIEGHRFEREQLRTMKQSGQQHCFSTLNHDLGYCYKNARVIKARRRTPGADRIRTPGCTCRKEPVMSQQNKALAQRYVEEVFTRRNLAALDDLLHPDYVWHGPGGEEVRGAQGARQMMEMYLGAFPDLEMNIDDIVAEGDRVVLRWTGRGTHKGPLAGAAPSGRAVSVSGIVITRVQDGRMAEDWEQFDQLGLFQQIGLVPAIAAAG